MREKKGQYPNYLTLECPSYCFNPNHWTLEKSQQWNSSSKIQMSGRTILFLLCLISTNGYALSNMPQGTRGMI